MNVCQSCKAEGWWAMSQQSGKAMLMDRDARADGTMTLVGHTGTGTPIVRAAKAGDHEDQRFAPHFATCPQADAWRRKPKARK